MIDISWKDFKALVQAKSLPVYYIFSNEQNKYLLLTKWGYFDFRCYVHGLADSADKTDFESSLKAAANTYPPVEPNLLGWASAVKQDTGNTSLASIDAKLTTTNSDLAAADTSLASIDTKFPTQGRKTSSGSLPTVEAIDPTYSCGFVSLNIAGSATDFFTITGSATKTVRVKKIELSFTVNVTLGASQSFDVQLVKRSTANSSGTSTTPAITPHDSSDAAATAVVRGYTVNPTLGSLVGVVRALKLTANSVNTTNPVVRVVWEFPAPVVLRGTSEVLAVNLNGSTLTSDDNAMSIEWSEV
jgi:hypothetical protein